MSIKRFLIILAFCVTISILIIVSPISKNFLSETPQPEAPILSQEVSFQKINNSLSIVEIGMSLSKYFDKVIPFKQNEKLPNDFIIFVNVSLVEKYRSFLSKELREGIPVIFVGNISSHFSEIASVIRNNSGMFFVPKEDNGTPCWIYGIFESPQNRLPGIPTPTNLFGAGGNERMAKKRGILDAYRWASMEANLAPLFTTTEGTYYSWVWIGSIESVLYFPPYGQMIVFTKYFYLYAPSSENSTLLLIHVYHKLIPGLSFSNPIRSYKWDWIVHTFFEKISSSNPKILLSDYFPTTCLDVNSLSINFGRIGAGDLETTNWRFSVGPSGVLVNVYDYSDYADNTAWWIWKVDRPLNKAFPLQAEPGAMMKICLNSNSHDSVSWNEEYGVQFSEKVGSLGGGQASPIYSWGYSVVLSWR